VFGDYMTYYLYAKVYIYKDKKAQIFVFHEQAETPMLGTNMKTQ